MLPISTGHTAAHGCTAEVTFRATPVGLIGDHIPPWKVVSELKKDYCVGAVLLCPWPIVESSDIMSAECLCGPHCVTQVYRLDNLPCVYVSVHVCRLQT